MFYVIFCLSWSTNRNISITPSIMYYIYICTHGNKTCTMDGFLRNTWPCPGLQCLDFTSKGWDQARKQKLVAIDSGSNQKLDLVARILIVLHFFLSPPWNKSRNILLYLKGSLSVCLSWIQTAQYRRNGYRGRKTKGDLIEMQSVL